MSRTLVRAAIGVAFLLACGSGASAAVGTQFAYQGLLADGGAPASGAYDFRCLLYDADVGGSQVGSTLVVGAVAVSQGRVTLELDFGDVFDGTALWLELHVRPTGSPSYSVLWPRQRIGPAPYAMLSDEATTAAWAVDAGQLGGQDPEYYLAWSSLTGVPAGLDDGDDDALGGLACDEGEVATWGGSAWTCDPDDGTLLSTYVVGPVGTAVENGAALIAAAAALPTATEAQPLLLVLEPGVYDVGAATLVLPPWVDLEGSGRRSTKIAGQAGHDLWVTATVQVVGGSEVRHLAIENNRSGVGYGAALELSTGARATDVEIVSTGGSDNPWAVCVLGGGVVLSDVDIIVLDGTATGVRRGIYAYGAPDLELSRVAITVLGVSGSQSDHGLYALQSSGGRLTLRDVEISVTGSSSFVYGVDAQSYAVVEIDGLDITASNSGDYAFGLSTVLASPGEIHVRDARFAATAADYVRAVRVSSQGGVSGTIETTHAEARGTGAASLVTGLSVLAPVAATEDTDLLILDSTLRGTYGLYVNYAGTGAWTTVRVRGSALEGDTFPIYTTPGNIEVKVGASMLSGSSSVGAAVACAGVWDESYTFYASTCP